MPHVFAILAALSAFAAATTAQQPAVPAFTVTDAMIPMRDGVKLHTKIMVPKDSKDCTKALGSRSTSYFLVSEALDKWSPYL